jgi:thiosulfate/3-mercaptopyruvate sulfurtransferase
MSSFGSGTGSSGAANARAPGRRLVERSQWSLRLGSCAAAVSSPLISVNTLSELLRSGKPRPTLLDTRWDHEVGAKAMAFTTGHIPGAVFVDLDRGLAASPGAGGRHPLPSAQTFAAAMRSRQVWNDRSVVVYDEATSMTAGRAWWLLRYFGHRNVRVLDGGVAAWVQAGRRLENGVGFLVAPGDFVARPGHMPLIEADDAAEIAERGILIDARASERFRGLAEPIDPVAGHIPGACNRPTAQNVDDSGRFLAPHVLREAFERLGVHDGVEIGAYCGSGVTAAHEVLALELAGYRAALYAGSWSEWIADPERPVARDQ